MRIHPISPETTGHVWQVTGSGVRRVTIRRTVDDTTRAISRFVFHDAARRTGGFSVRAAHAPTSDLFLVEQDARIEFNRRQDQIRCVNDRRVGRERRDGELSPVEGVLAGFAIGLSFLAMLI